MAEHMQNDTTTDDRTRLAAVRDIPEDEGLRVKVGSDYIALFRKGDRVSAIDAICPHAGAFLDQGYFDGTVVMCPLHGWDFDVETGASPSYGIETRCFRVQVVEGDVYLLGRGEACTDDAAAQP